MTIPKGRRKAKPTIEIANAQETVFTPAINPRPGMIVRKEGPGVAVGRVIFADRPPLTLTQIRSPKVPGFTSLVARENTLGFSFGGHNDFFPSQKNALLSLRF
jgi:hypothetical protein